MTADANDLSDVKRLLREWDPIGVFSSPVSSDDDPWPDDEYDSYAPRVYAHLESRSGVRGLADYLEMVRVESMGLSRDSEADLAMARRLFDWYESMRRS